MPAMLGQAALSCRADSGAGGGERDPLPCAIMEAGDDAAALEASLIENIARLDSDEVTRWESFTRLVKEGRSPENISLTFGLTELQVKRTLVLFRPGNTLFANASPRALFLRVTMGQNLPRPSTTRLPRRPNPPISIAV